MPPTAKLKLFMCAVAAAASAGARPALAEVQVRATVDHAGVGQGDTLQYQVSVSADDSVNVEPPPVERGIDGFDVQGASTGFETRSSYDNGRFVTRQSRVFTYQLMALKKGKFTIPAFEVGVNGRAYKTNPLAVAVGDRRRPAPGSVPPGGSDDVDDMENVFQQMMQRHFGGAPGGGGAIDPAPVNPNDAFVIQAQVDKQKVYVGEQVTANFYLLTRGQVRDIDTLRYPDLKGFWKEDLEMATRLNFESVTVGGIPYQRALLVSYALFPIKAGTSTVDPYTAKCTVITPTAFGFGHPYVFTKSSAPIKLEVADVPAERPANYTGAVGAFRLHAQFEPAVGSVNQPVTLRVRVEGKGNAKLIELPKLNLPPSFEFYDQKSQAQFAKDGSSFKEFEVLMIPREPGVHKIEPVTVAVFDPSAKKFTEVSSGPLSLSVTGSAATPGAPSLPGEKSAAPAPAVDELPDLATELGPTPWPPQAVWSAVLALWLVTLLAILVGAVRLWRGVPKKAGLSLILRRRLEKVKGFEASGDYRRTGVELTNAAYAILGPLSGQGGAHQELERLLEGTPPSLRNELAADIRKVLDDCATLSFAPEHAIGDLRERAKLTALRKEFARVLQRAIDLAEV